jgi:hypothetical protein
MECTISLKKNGQYSNIRYTEGGVSVDISTPEELQQFLSEDSMPVYAPLKEAVRLIIQDDPELSVEFSNRKYNYTPASMEAI